ncbi:MAG: Cof-type HAD-IIB family hydrolase [Oscillospiraceae bacterium]|nr:Cof-type HAD-IIB family hydrolase [Oscillospiraceae bacterium]
MIKIIVTDLDNTLLRSDKSISDRTITVLKECRTKGIKIVFATARSTQSASRFLEQFTPDIFVGYGGALVSAGEEVIHRFDISAEIAARIIKDCLNTPEISAILAINESVALTNNVEALAEKDSAHYQYVDSLTDCNYSYLKISINAASQPAIEKIAANYPTLDMLRYTGENLYRFANRNAVKWNALTAISKHFNVSTDTFVAFGDDVNDLEMIAKCGIGVAVENAIDEVKAVAGYICGSNDNDGVANWLKKHILNR